MATYATANAAKNNKFQGLHVLLTNLPHRGLHGNTE